ncbi:MAG TPA: hypothetical protein VIK77_04160 [Tissierellaceae bacterium]
MENKNIDEIMDLMKDYKPSEEEMEKFENLVDEYKDKSEKDLFIEIIKVNESLEKNLSEEEYREIFEKIESIRPLLSEEQNKKLDEILKILKKK